MAKEERNKWYEREVKLVDRPAVGEWRRVEDGLPEPADFGPWERVLVVVRDFLSGPKSDDVSLAYLDDGAPAPGWRDDQGRLPIMPSRGFLVTHWTRLPGPPQGSTPDEL